MRPHHDLESFGQNGDPIQRQLGAPHGTVQRAVGTRREAAFDRLWH